MINIYYQEQQKIKSTFFVELGRQITELKDEKNQLEMKIEILTALEMVTVHLITDLSMDKFLASLPLERNVYLKIGYLVR